MAKNSVTIDWSKAVRDARKAGKDIHSVFDKKINQVFDFESVKRFKMANIDAFESLTKGANAAKKDLAALKAAYAGLEDKAGSAGKSMLESIENQTEATKKYNDELKKLISTSTRANYLQRVGGRMLTSAKSAGKESGAMGTVGRAIGGIGDAVAGIAESPLGMLGMGAAALYGGAMALSAPRRRMAGTNVGFMGLSKERMSRGDLEQISLGGAAYGFDRDETMQQASTLQATAGNVTAKSGRGNMASFASMQRFSGMDAGSMAQMVASQRAAAQGTAGIGLTENLAKTQKMIEAGFKAGLDSSAAIRYWQITSEMTKKMADEGTVDAQSIQDAMSGLAGKSGFFGANMDRTGAAITGVNEAFKSEGGAGLALMAMQQSGIMKGMGPMEALMAQKGGIFQADTTLSNNMKFGMHGKGGADLMNKYISGIATMGTGLTKENYGDTSRAGRERVAGAAANISAVTGLGPQMSEQLLDAVMGKGKAVDPKAMADAMRSSNDIMNSMDGKMQQNEALMKNLVLKVGEVIAPALTSINNAVLKIASKIAGYSPDKSAGDYQKQVDSANAQIRRGYGVGDTLKDMVGLGPLSDVAKGEAGVAAANMKTGGDTSKAGVMSALGINPGDFNHMLQKASDNALYDPGSNQNDYMMNQAQGQIASIQDAMKTRQAQDADNNVDSKKDNTLQGDAQLLTMMKDFVAALQQAMKGIPPASFIPPKGTGAQ